MRRLLVLSLALVLLAACTNSAAPGRPEVTTAEPEATPVQPGPVSSPLPGQPAPNEGAIPVPSAMPEGMRRVELAAGQSITEPGLYYMDVATGTLEGWLMPPFDPQRSMRWVQTTPDHRWLTFGLDGWSYLIRRRDAKVFRYHTERIPVVPGPGIFLLLPPYGRSGEGVLVDEEMLPISTFPVKAGYPEVLFSPDGQKLAVGERSGGGSLSLIDVATGTVTKLAEFPDDEGVRFLPLPELGEFVAIHGDYLEPLRLERYTWQGDYAGRMEVDGWGPAISDDGRTVAVMQSHGQYGQATALHKWQEDEPFLRVAGALGPAWLAGGAELVVSTRLGWQLVAKSGEMRPVPGDGEPRWQHFGWYLPSTDTPDLFVTGTKVIDRAGRVVHSTQIADGAQARALSAAWGPASREVQFEVIPPLGKGFEVEPWTNFLPSVQRLPFPAMNQLEVGDPAGECVNLRAEPTLSGRILRCLPTGTRLTPALTPDGHLNTPSADRLMWMAVDLETGEKGWLAIDTGSIAYGH